VTNFTSASREAQVLPPSAFATRWRTDLQRLTASTSSALTSSASTAKPKRTRRTKAQMIEFRAQQARESSNNLQKIFFSFSI